MHYTPLEGLSTPLFEEHPNVGPPEGVIGFLEKMDNATDRQAKH